jgi:hypothetical protein
MEWEAKLDGCAYFRIAFVLSFLSHSFQRWIFIIEGLVTIVAGILSYWLIVDFPDTASFITEKERECIIEGLEEDGQFSARGEKFNMKYVWMSLRDWKTWLCSES